MPQSFVRLRSTAGALAGSIILTLVLFPFCLCSSVKTHAHPTMIFKLARGPCKIISVEAIVSRCKCGGAGRVHFKPAQVQEIVEQVLQKARTPRGPRKSRQERQAAVHDRHHLNEHCPYPGCAAARR